jgi:hypothetical protein
MNAALLYHQERQTQSSKMKTVELDTNLETFHEIIYGKPARCKRASRFFFVGALSGLFSVLYHFIFFKKQILKNIFYQQKWFFLNILKNTSYCK